MIRVLMIEDDREMAELLKEYLERFSIDVTNYTNPEVGLSALRTAKFDAIILDLSLPEIDGLEVCRLIRQEYDTPLIISSARNDITDKAACFSAGADDYLPKPYESRELVLRIQSLLRRYKPQNHEAPAPVRPLKCDAARMEAFCHDKRLKLTQAEFEIFAYLLKREGYVVSREELLMNVESIKYESTLKSIDVIISRLRQKVEEDPKNPQYIHSIRGMGYKLINE